MNNKNMYFIMPEEQKKTIEINVKENFILNNNYYYLVPLINEINPENEDDSDELEINTLETDENYQENKIIEFFKVNKIKEITQEDFKTAEKESNIKNKDFINKFTQEEKFIFEKTQDLIENMDFKKHNQINFLNALRKEIVNNKEDFNTYLLEDIAAKKNKEINSIFDTGQQEIICDYFNEVKKSLNKKQIKL